MSTHIDSAICNISEIDTWYLANLVCPVVKTTLKFGDKYLISNAGRRYPVIDGIPVMLNPGTEQTHGTASASLKLAKDTLQNPDIQRDAGTLSGYETNQRCHHRI